jgi:hypothetical protein
MRFALTCNEHLKVTREFLLVLEGIKLSNGSQSRNAGDADGRRCATPATANKKASPKHSCWAVKAMPSDVNISMCPYPR